jgi:hypothetical protein
MARKQMIDRIIVRLVEHENRAPANVSRLKISHLERYGDFYAWVALVCAISLAAWPFLDTVR